MDCEDHVGDAVSPSISSTSILACWAHGSAQAERFAAAVLGVIGYTEIKPQAPRGGPDGKKDILASKNGISYCCAVYFPSTPKDFKDIGAKFKGDLEGVSANGCNGFIFFTNQHISIGNKNKLRAEALENDEVAFCEIVDLEQTAAFLENPTAYGIRLRFLGVTMTREEQIAFIEASNSEVTRLLGRNGLALDQILRRIETMGVVQQDIRRTMLKLPTGQPLKTAGFNLGSAIFFAFDLEADSDDHQYTQYLSVSQILGLHMVIQSADDYRVAGKLRKLAVTISGVNDMHPPPASAVYSRLNEICEEWVTDYDTIFGLDDEARLKAISEFHHKFLLIHPFTDANGRTARAISAQMLLDMFGKALMSLFPAGQRYYKALGDADNGNIETLVNAMKPAAGFYDPRSLS